MRQFLLRNGQAPGKRISNPAQTNPLNLVGPNGCSSPACRLVAIARDRASRFPDHADPVRDLRAAEGLMRRIEAAVKAKVQ